ncbi:hypothetical protein [Neptuniibacter marinus]|uniref:hypothetical protein n=1 Tax=Neptuniibacter marinus TaxID=1806670 RepID=UPI00082C2F44|nr:hypothetical protein [Neptuniibacter marinus]
MDKLDGSLRLVKDLSSSGIVYFWIDKDEQKLSPDIPSLPLAEEWWTNYLFSLFDGPERRYSLIDRRQDKNQRKDIDQQLFSNRLNPAGRRESDKPIQVDLDRVADKLKIYYS